MMIDALLDGDLKGRVGIRWEMQTVYIDVLKLLYQIVKCSE